MSLTERAVRLQALASTLAGKPAFWVVLIVAMFTWPIVRSLGAARDLPQQRPVLGQVRDFTLRDQNGEEFGVAELRGRLWVASVVEVACEPTCLDAQRSLSAMNDVRHRTRNLGDAIRLVTFALAAEDAPPEKAVELAASHRASHGNWRFVSTPPAEVRDVLRDFERALATPPGQLALVDGNMRIRGYYDTREAAALPLLLRDVSLLLSRGD